MLRQGLHAPITIYYTHLKLISYSGIQSQLCIGQIIGIDLDLEILIFYTHKQNQHTHQVVNIKPHVLYSR